MLALLYLVSSCLLSILRAAPLIILILHEIMLEKNYSFLSGFSLPISIFLYKHGFTNLLGEVAALRADFSLSFKASLVLGSVSRKNSNVHFSLFYQSKTFAFSSAVSGFCGYPTYTESQALQNFKKRGSRDIG